MMNARSTATLRAPMVLTAVLMLSLNVTAGNFSTGLAAGYKGGFTVRASAGIMGFAKGFPLGLEGSVGYSVLDPGNAADARRIFVNDATNGTPEKNGHAWDLRLDFVYDLQLLREGAVYAYGGVRYSMFTGEYVFVGGNEDFEVSTSQWGIGAGLQGKFSMSPRVDFVLGAGVDYYFSAPLIGHDTTYDPNGDNVNGRTGYFYKDADGAVNQPRFQPSVMIGIGYNF